MSKIFLPHLIQSNSIQDQSNAYLRLNWDIVVQGSKWFSRFFFFFVYLSKGTWNTLSPPPLRRTRVRYRRIKRWGTMIGVGKIKQYSNVLDKPLSKGKNEVMYLCAIFFCYNSFDYHVFLHSYQKPNRVLHYCLHLCFFPKSLFCLKIMTAYFGSQFIGLLITEKWEKTSKVHRSVHLGTLC